jgi:hypothetical protein
MKYLKIVKLLLLSLLVGDDKKVKRAEAVNCEGG